MGAEPHGRLGHEEHGRADRRGGHGQYERDRVPVEDQRHAAFHYVAHPYEHAHQRIEKRPLLRRTYLGQVHVQHARTRACNRSTRNVHLTPLVRN